MEWYCIKKAPLVLGHEVARRRRPCGRGRHVAAGRRPRVRHPPRALASACTACAGTRRPAVRCRRSTTSRRVASRSTCASGRSVRTGILKLPDAVSYEVGTFVEPLATVVRGLRTTGLAPGRQRARLRRRHRRHAVRQSSRRPWGRHGRRRGRRRLPPAGGAGGRRGPDRPRGRGRAGAVRGARRMAGRQGRRLHRRARRRHGGAPERRCWRRHRPSSSPSASRGTPSRWTSTPSGATR